MKPKFRIVIQVIPHTEQEYDTCGYYKRTDRGIGILVSNMNDWRYNLLVGLHELVEVALCEQNGIKDETIDEFDIQYEKNRKEGDLSEPGNNRHCPYRRQHRTATLIEKIVSRALRVNWKEYNKVVELL